MGTLAGPAATADVRTFKLLGKPLKEDLKRSMLHFATFDAQILLSLKSRQLGLQDEGLRPATTPIQSNYFPRIFYLSSSASITTTCPSTGAVGYELGVNLTSESSERPGTLVELKQQICLAGPSILHSTLAARRVSDLFR